MPGNRAAVGRRTNRAWKAIFDATFAEDMWREVILKAVEQARRGDRHARRFLADYSIGRPLQRVEAAIFDGDHTLEPDFRWL